MKTTKIVNFSAGTFILLSACSFLSVSIMAFRNPQAVMDLVHVRLDNTDAFSSIRGVYGGVGLALSVSLVYLLFTDIRKGLNFLAMIWGFYALSRLITIKAEGALGAFGQQWLVTECVFFSIAILLLFLGRKTSAFKTRNHMKAISRVKLLSSLEKDTEAHVTQAVHIFQNLPEEQLLKQPANGGWSIAQCLEHLNSYGRYYLPAIGKGLAKPAGSPANEVFVSTWLGNYFTKMMQPGAKTKKYKSPKDHMPAAGLDAYAVVSEFIRQQEQLLVYLRMSREADINAILIPISISRFIKLKLGDTFRFLIAHNERHMQQAGKLLQGYRLPEAQVLV